MSAALAVTGFCNVTVLELEGHPTYPTRPPLPTAPYQRLFDDTSTTSFGGHLISLTMRAIAC